MWGVWSIWCVWGCASLAIKYIGIAREHSVCNMLIINSYENTLLSFWSFRPRVWWGLCGNRCWSYATSWRLLCSVRESLLLDLKVFHQVRYFASFLLSNCWSANIWAFSSFLDEKKEKTRVASDSCLSCDLATITSDCRSSHDLEWVECTFW